MGAFDRAKKILRLGRGGRNSSAGRDQDFDFDELESMSGEFDDDHTVTSDRKSSIKSYVKEHYSSKLTDNAERKRLIKSTLPASYSGTVDLASDLKDDFDSIRYDLSKEWQKQSGSIKKTVKGFEQQLKFLRMNKLVDWANRSDSRGGYQEDEASQNEAMVANLMGGFPSMPSSSKAMKFAKDQQKQQIKEKEDVAEYRASSLSAQLRGTVSSEQSVSELRKLTNYQDQVTYSYQKKSLEMMVRSFVEHKTQTEILRTYKDESIAELKEIHKNTGLPEAVKINQSEFAAQAFKQKMMGNVANWFDGNLAGVRKRVVSRIRTKLTDMTKEFGSSLENFIGMAGADDEQGGGGIAKLLLGMGADALLDRPYNAAADTITGKLRNKLMGNRRIAKAGKGLQSIISGLGSSVNHALVTGESGNGALDSLMDFFGLRQAATTRNDKLRGSLRDSLDTATHMDVKFKQSVERVIPGWLKLIHKENYLIRTQQTDDKKFKEIDWDWDTEKFTGTQEIRQKVMTRIFNRDKVIETAEAYDGLMNAFGAFALPPAAQEKLRDWLRKRVTSSLKVSPFFLYIDRENVFGKDDAVIFEQLADYMGHMGDLDEDLISQGVINESVLRFNNQKYGAWAMKTDAAYKRVTSVDVFDRAELQRLYDQGMGHFAEEIGAAVRADDGSVNISTDFADGIFKRFGRKKHTQSMFFKDGETRTVRSGGRSKSVMGYEIDESRTDSNWEDILNDEYTLENNESNRNMNHWLTDDVISERSAHRAKAAIQHLLGAMDLVTSTEAGKRGMSDRFTRAAGGYIPSFAKGGPTGDDKAVDEEIHAKLHGKEFITDKETTEKNRKLLEFMNKFKAPVVMPDGSVNPIYYKAFGYKTEEAFKNSDMDVSLKREETQFFRKINNAKDADSAQKVITELFTAIDLNQISDKDFKTLTNNHVPNKEKFKLFLEIRKNQSKKKGTKASILGAGLSRVRNGLEGKGSDAEKIEKLKGSAKSFYEKAKAEVLKMSDEQADVFINKALGTINSDSLSDAEMEILTDPAVPSKDKALMIAKLTLRRDDKVAVTKKAVIDGLKSVKAKTKNKLKDLINGGTEDTTNSDNLKAIGDIFGNKVKQGTDFAKSKVDIIRQLAEGGQLDEKAKEYANKVLVKLRMDKAARTAKKFWSDVAIDIYVNGSLDFPRLNVIGFANGAYIDQETGRVLATHHDITGPVVTKDGEFVLEMADFAKGLVDKEGKPIFINSLKRYRNQAKEKAKELYNKYAKKHVDKGIDSFLSMSEKWQAMFKKTDIDIYIGDGKEPRLTAAGFREGKYISVLKKKPLKGYLDIDGPIMLADGTMVITTEEITASPMRDKDGNTIRPPKLMSAMGRLGSLVWNALSFDKAYNVGKKAFTKLKNAWTGWRNKNKKKEGEEGEEEEKLGTEPGKRYGQKLKDKFKKFAGYETNEDGGKTLRVGSWQWKRKKKEEDGWMSRFSGMFGGKGKEEGGKKKGILGKLLGAVMGIGGVVFGAVNKLTSGITGGLFKMAKWLVPSLGAGVFKAVSWLAKPILSSLAFIGKAIIGRGVGGGLGGIGRMARVGGMAAGGYMMYQGLKGSEKTDENGQPVLDANGQPVMEKDYTGAAMGAGMMALSTGTGLKLAGRGLMAAGGLARVGLGLLTGPVGWAMLGATAAYYGGKLALGKWRKGKAAEESPMLSFRINQYGFDLTDEKSTSSLMQLESVLQPNLVLQGEKANFKSDMDVESVFGIFGLKFQGGDPEKNKKFLTWFLGRFKPVYLSYIREVNALKKTTDISDLDKKLTASDRITILDKVHFKNQTDMNPYNILVSPFEDPDEAEYDFEDMEDRYEKTKSILDEKAATETTPGDKPAAKTEEKETSLTDSVTTGLKYGGLAGGIIGGSIFALKKLSSGAADIFNKTTEGIGKSMSGFMDSLMSNVSSAWDKVKSFGASVGGAVGAAGEAVGDAVGTVTNTISNAAADTWQGIKETANNIFGNNKSADIAKVIEVGKGYNVVQTKDGSIIKQTGAWNWRNNNPGNITDNEWARSMGAIDQGKIAAKGSGRFAVFPTYAAGRNAKAALIFSGKNYRELDLMSAIARYAPPHENNTANYQRVVLAAVGGQNKRMKEYSNDERIKILNAMEKLEGLKAGSVQVIQKGTGPVGNASQSTGVMKADATTGGAKGVTNAPAGVKKEAGALVAGAAAKVKNPVGSGVLLPGAPAGSAKVVSNPTAATPKANTSAAGAPASVMSLCTPELVAAGKQHYSLWKGGKGEPVSLEGMHPTFMTLFYAMIGESAKRRMPVVVITEGVRSIKEQWRLYNLYKAGHGALAAYPGKSRHGKGEAMDINTPNADQLEKSGLMAKYGFSRPLMKRKKNGKMTETWHIENKFVTGSKSQAQYGKMNDPAPVKTVSVASSSPSVDNVSYQGGQGGSSNASISGVMSAGGFAGTTAVSTAQRNDTGNMVATNNILSQQLKVQTQIKDTLIEIKNFMIKPAAEIDQLKKKQSPENIGNTIGMGVAEAIAEKYGLGKPNEKAKPSAVISVAK